MQYQTSCRAVNRIVSIGKQQLEGPELTCSGTSVAGKRSETMAVNRTASSIRNLGMLLLRMAMISNTASSMPARLPYYITVYDWQVCCTLPDSDVTQADTAAVYMRRETERTHVHS